MISNCSSIIKSMMTKALSGCKSETKLKTEVIKGRKMSLRGLFFWQKHQGMIPLVSRSSRLEPFDLTLNVAIEQIVSDTFNSYLQSGSSLSIASINAKISEFIISEYFRCRPFVIVAVLYSLGNFSPRKFGCKENRFIWSGGSGPRTF